MSKFKKNQTVEWKWGNGTATGTIEEVFTDKVERTISGSTITRNASEDNPAYLIKQEDGSKALKSESELS